jgi:hypothetical protein
MVKLMKTEIQSVEDLKQFFFENRNYTNTANCYVSTNIRREWMLNHEVTIINGRVYNINFKNLKGGVWQASLALKTTKPNN